MQNILKKLDIDEKFTKKPKNEKSFTRVADCIPHKKGYNYMCDLLILPIDEKTKHRYLLVIVDLATREFDIEAMKTKTADATLQAMRKNFNRGRLKKPEASIRTDGGTEFKSEFQKYCYENSIYHSVCLPNRHTQMSCIESLNKQLGRLLNGYMNSKELETGKTFTEWDNVVVLDIIRNDLNELRKINPSKLKYSEYNLKADPKYKAGDIVHRLLDTPKNALGHDQNTNIFRAGDYAFDTTPKKITSVLFFPGDIPFRYILEGLDNVSFTERQLMPAIEKETKYVVERIIGTRQKNKVKQVLIKWKAYKIDQATWEPEKNIIEDVGNDSFKVMMNEYKSKK